MAIEKTVEKVAPEVNNIRMRLDILAPEVTGIGKNVTNIEKQVIKTRTSTNIGIALLVGKLIAAY